MSVLQLNNTCDLIAGDDKVYMSSRNRNQFFALREMLPGHISMRVETGNCDHHSAKNTIIMFLEKFFYPECLIVNPA